MPWVRQNELYQGWQVEGGNAERLYTCPACEPDGRSYESLQAASVGLASAKEPGLVIKEVFCDGQNHRVEVVSPKVSWLRLVK